MGERWIDREREIKIDCVLESRIDSHKKIERERVSERKRDTDCFCVGL